MSYKIKIKNITNVTMNKKGTVLRSLEHSYTAKSLAGDIQSLLMQKGFTCDISIEEVDG